jgi:dimethylargininase
MKITPRRVLASLAAAALVLFITIDANGLAFFLANGMKSELLSQVVVYFLPAELLLLVLAFVGGFFGGYINRWLALALGVVASGIAGFVGVYIEFSTQPIDGVPFETLVGAIFGQSVVFITAATVAAVTAGFWLFNRIAGTAGRTVGQVALVRAPASNLADGLVTHIKRKKLDLDKANDQWDAYVETLNACGWQTVEVDPRDDLADSVFIEDTVVMIGKTAVITSPGADARAEEVIATEQKVRELGLKVERISQPGTLDGGDVLKVGGTIYVGRGGRTNGEGIRQFRAIASKLGYTVVAVPVTKALHLKTAVTALPDGTIIGYPPLVDNTELFPRFQPVPEAHGTAVVVLAPDLLLMSAAAPKTAVLLQDLGYNVVTVDISEFEKLEGCVTCLSVRVR